MKGRHITALLFISVYVFGLVLIQSSCERRAEDTGWLDTVHEQGRTLFYRMIREKITNHPKKAQLTEKEITKIMEAETRYDRLYELLMNIFYIKDELVFQSLLEKGDRNSKTRFSERYLDLARFAAGMFVDCFFTTDFATEYARKNFPKYKDLDAVDLVIRSIGYDAKLDIPEVEMFVNPLSPEFDKQGALDAARFRQAHKITKGKGAKIAILDTGIDESHSVFKNTKWGKHFSLVGREGKPWASFAPVVDWGYHGTLISSVATRYAPEAELTMYKFGDGDTQNDPPYMLLMECMVAACIYKAVHDGNDIISISASGASIDSDYLREACDFAYENNRIVISGALYSKWFKLGNVLNYPAQYETVVSVTAADRHDDGTYGYWDVCAPDDTNTVAAPNDIFGAFPTYVEEEDDYIPSISAAIPTVAALFALVVSEYPRLGSERPGEYARTLMNLVIENANPHILGFEGFTPECGYGMIDAEKSVKAAALLNEKRSGSASEK
jgi:hypothetical protein